MGGLTRQLTKTEAVILKQLDMALRGEQRPAERFLDRIEQFTPVEVDADLIGALLSEDQDLLAIARGRGVIGPSRSDIPSGPEPGRGPVQTEQIDYPEGDGDEQPR